MGKKSGDTVNLRISKEAYKLLVDIKKLLVEKGKTGRESSFKKIIEDALREYKEKLEG